MLNLAKVQMAREQWHVVVEENENCTRGKPVLNGHSKIDNAEVLQTDCSLMLVENIAECSSWSILQYF